jgi:hypothetical protein
MILFQQVKQVLVAGSLLRGPILKMLIQERKIPEPVSAALKALSEEIDQDKSTNEDLVTVVKECGLCREISKHEISGIE